MIKRSPTFFINKIQPLNFCGNEVGYLLDISGIFEKPFEINPTKGEHDFNKCENCKKNIIELTKKLKEKFEGNEHKKGFPFCCTPHSNLTKVEGFKISDFFMVPEMTAKKIIYTYQHIKNNHNTNNWYKEITDYIEWVFDSFGKMPKECGEPLYLTDYFSCIKDLLKKNKDVPIEKRDRILEFINLYLTPSKQSTSDLNILIQTYENWIKIFPFELESYFGNIKQQFEKTIPILTGKPEINIYSGEATVKLQTKSSLIESLINLTDNILRQINGLAFYEKGLITDVNNIKLELVLSSRKSKMKKGYINNSPDEEQRYRKIIKEWFKDEKKFYREITPLLKEALAETIEQYLENGNLIAFFNYLKSIFANTPYELLKNQKSNEAFFHIRIHDILVASLGFKQIEVEKSVSEGRSDLIYQNENYVYIFEFKFKLTKNETPDDAINQIKEKKYYEPYLSLKKKIILVGVVFNSTNIEDWKTQDYISEK
jgi:hypothetical protein